MNNNLIEKIEKLKGKRNAVILAHNYQPGPIQDIADFAGDSLGLSVKAAETNADVIVFCGVQFMAETAAVLSPEKTVLLPEKNAGCPMADMINGEQLRKLKGEYPDALVVCYVNSPAEVKAESDVCCTSANAVEVVKSLPQDRRIIFVPDKYLGSHVRNLTGREVILWPGYCPTHMMITAADIKNLKEQHPEAVVMVHPECTEAVKEVADKILSTGQMLKFASTDGAREFIVGTETGILHTLKKQNPDKEFIPVTERAVCPNMKMIPMEKIAWSLEDMQHEVTVPADVARKAKKALDRMIEILPMN